ncbi:MAG: hypothetical protein H7A09_04580 [Oceanospirillaceae bacterium]|nr:hypothetical protein [Oceanospirillaceae bacterium]MCP5349483.1 hypothetical protein [Oceanospirillaceae bacterium]
MIDQIQLQHLSPGEFWAFFILIAALTAVCLYFYIQKYRHARAIEDTPTSRVRSAAQGFTELEGRALYPNDTALISPLSQTPCAWFRFTVSKLESSGKSSHWKVIRSGTSPVPLVLADPTGTCLIHTGRASVDTHLTRTWRGHSPMPQGKVDFLPGLLMGANYKYYEELILENTPLYALGHFRTIRADDNFQLEKTVAEVIIEWKKNYADLVERFDRNADGKLDEKEWQLVRLAATLEAEKLQKNLQSQPQVHVMEKPADGSPFIVSTREQLSLIERSKMQSFLWLAGFIAAGAFCTYLLQLRFS